MDEIIFINYRRGDEPGFVGRIYDRLEEKYSKAQLFMDIDNIPAGANFVQYLDDKLSHTTVLLAVIGNQWLNVRDEKGARRLDNPDDLVRMEIAKALAGGKRVIPVLVAGAKMPSPDDLPVDLKPLAFRNAVGITHERFASDIKTLEIALEESTNSKETGDTKATAASRRAMLGGAAFAAAVATGLAWSVRGQLFSGKPKALLVFREHTGPIYTVKFSTSGKKVVSSQYEGDFSARLWQASTGQQIAKLWHYDHVTTASFSPTGTRVVTSSYDTTAKIWDAAAGEWLGTLVGHEYGAIWSAVFSPDGKKVVTCCHDKTARIWDVENIPVSKQVVELHKLAGHADHVWRAIFSPDGKRVATTSNDTTGRLFDASNGEVIAVLEHGATPLSVAFTPDGSRLATTCTDGTARIWDGQTGKPITTLRGHSMALLSVAFSPDGARLITTSEDHTARLWDVDEAQEIAVLKGHELQVINAVFSKDGKLVATVSSDKTARLWNGLSGDEIAILAGHEDDVQSADFSPDGTQLATSSLDKTVRIWSI